MLYIRSYETLYHHGDSLTWCVGEVNPKFNEEDTDFVVQADGDELKYILSTFVNIPCTTKCLQRWFGEMAKFIVMNL